jgi:hypothetical protein
MIHPMKSAAPQGRTGRIAPIVLVALIAVVIGTKIVYAGKAPLKLPLESCDRLLWNHVNHKERLRVIEECTAVEGRVVSLHRAADW